jgi:hypothetical protein
MKYQIKVTWQAEEFIEVEVDEEEAEELAVMRAENAVKHILPGNHESYDWEWWVEPKFKGDGDKPPEDYWFTIDGQEYATNGHIIITRDCNVDFKNRSRWVKIDEPSEVMLELIRRDRKGYKSYNDYIHAGYKGFSGCKLLSSGIGREDKQKVIQTFICQGRKLLAIIPASQTVAEDYVQLD